MKLTINDYVLIGSIVFPVAVMIISCVVSVFRDTTHTNKESKDENTKED